MKALILGGVFAGTTTAFLLKREGWDVTLVEKEPHLGGGYRTFFHAGHPFTYKSRRQALREEDAAVRRLALQEKDGVLKDHRDALDRDRERSRAAEMELVRAETDRQHLDELCRQELGMSAEEAAATAGESAEQADPGILEAQIQELKARIEGIGPVNLTAIEEFAGLEERRAFLTSQRQDLDDAMASLRESIKRINRTSRDRFIEAFAQIRTSYREIYHVLFNGGRADLVLEEGEDVLECGIEMVAQPPGKRLGHVSLLSGGEKAMSAIALLFAIFRYQPSPFCLLDEVDAALDELNVGRFTRMLKEYAGHTQFILITHTVTPWRRISEQRVR